MSLKKQSTEERPGKEIFFHNKNFVPAQHDSCSAAAAALATICCCNVWDMENRIVPSNPRTWLLALQDFGLNLEYWTTWLCEMRWFMSDLLMVDDLFLLCYYTTVSPDEVMAFESQGMTTECFHIVILHRCAIIDPVLGECESAFLHPCNGMLARWIFRVVPAERQGWL